MKGIETNWYVITGGPCAGKSKTLDHLAYLGHKVIPEAARIIIDEEISRGKSLKDIRGDELAFQDRVLQMKLDTEERLNPSELIFLERGIPDSDPYIALAGGNTEAVIELSRRRVYRVIFLLDQVSFEADYARTEDNEKARRINALLKESYSGLGYRVIQVPVMPISQRADFILKEVTALNSALAVR
jgi:predicted ATPase